MYSVKENSSIVIPFEIKSKKEMKLINVNNKWKVRFFAADSLSKIANRTLLDDVNAHDQIFQKILNFFSCFHEMQDRIFHFFTLSDDREVLNADISFYKEKGLLKTDERLTISILESPVFYRKQAESAKISNKLLETWFAFAYAHELAHIEFWYDKDISVFQNRTQLNEQQEEMVADKRGLEIAMQAGYSASDCIISSSLFFGDKVDEIHKTKVERGRYMLDHYLDLCDKQQKSTDSGDKKIKFLSPEEAQQLIAQDFVTEEQKTRLKQGSRPV